MASWDVFHADSLELERGLSTDAVRAAAAGGTLRDDDLVRPSGTTVSWSRLGDLPELTGPEAATAPRADESPAASAEPSPAPPFMISRELEPRPEHPTAPAEPPERIRAARDVASPARPASSDFELQADQLDPAPQSDAPAATAAPPAWLELGREPDDVTFPVIPGRTDDRLARTPPPRDAGREPERESPVPAAWDWPDDEEDGDDADEANIPDLDEQIEILDDDDVGGLEILDEDSLSVPSPSSRESTGSNGASHVSLPVVPSRDWNEDRAPVEGAEEDDFTLSRSGPMTVEELDLAAMVDVAFQLVLFFMVTATTVLYKALEVPKPTTDQAPSSVAQGHSRSVEDLQKDYILVEIDAEGAIKIDREPVPATVDALAERLRTAREKTNRKIMLLSADYQTPHRNSVLAYDAAIEAHMGIAIARPNAPQGPAPSVFPGPGRAGAARPAADGAPTKAPAPPAAAPAPTAAPPAAPPAGGVPF